MKKLNCIFFAIVLVMPMLTLAQDAMKPSDSEEISKTAVSISGKVTNDGKTIIGDKDSKNWIISNPDALKQYAGQRVTIKGNVDAENNEIRVIEVTSVEMNYSVVNLDSYHPVAETSLKFGFNKGNLTPKAKEALDQLAETASHTEGYIFALEASTDAVGATDYNDALSQHRADAVIQYLVSKHDVPVHKMYVIGLGKDKPLESNKTSEGRADNRRVDVRLLTTQPNYHVVRVFYATDRELTGSSEPGNYYSPKRSEDGSLHFGSLDVSVPVDHHMAEIERPSIWHLEFREDPEKHLVLLKVLQEPETQFFQDVAAQVDSSPDRDAFVFVHGYANTFEEAAWRTAQLAYDLGFEGAPILYSWPSRGEVGAYPADEATIDWTTPHLKAFLEKIASVSHARTVHLIAHSMGNRALTNALVSIAAERSSIPPLFKQILLAAPDIDAGVFRQLAENFPRLADRITLYASSKDKALIASRKFHRSPRAGDSGKAITIVSKVDTIDATAVDTGLFGHSYYADNRSILSDIFSLIRTGDPPDKRFGMRAAHLNQMTYWQFRP